VSPLRYRSRAGLGAGLVGTAGLAASVAGLLFSTRSALFAWLFAWAYWTGLAVAALLLLCIFHASRARWPVVFRRVLETLAGTLPLMAVLFIPVLLGVKELYPWASPEAVSRPVALLLAHQRPYMNFVLWLLRALLYLAVWVAVAEGLLRLSRRQDREGGIELTRRQRRLGTAALIPTALAMSFAALDWLMALDPSFRSGIFPLYWFTGSLLAAIALLAVWITASREAEPAKSTRASHRASLAKLLFAFSLFWVYVAFCQWLLTWIADLPDEVPWFLIRTSGNWGQLAALLVIAQFGFPFVALLRRNVKENSRMLAAVALLVLAAHALDLFWLVMPTRDPASPLLHWTDLAAFAAVGGLAIAFAHVRFARHAPLPAKDPYLLESLRYSGT